MSEQEKATVRNRMNEMMRAKDRWEAIPDADREMVTQGSPQMIFAYAYALGRMEEREDWLGRKRN